MTMMSQNRSSILMLVGLPTLASTVLTFASAYGAIWALAGSDSTATIGVAQVWRIGLALAIALPIIINPMVAAPGALRLRELSRDRDELADAAHKDSLTGLLNRRGFDAAARRVMENASSDGRPVAILCDIDHFKSINDRYGHEVGDVALAHVAATLAGSLAGRLAVLGRIGGEEFAALVADVDLEQAMRLADSMRAACEAARIGVDGAEIGLTISLGVALAPPGVCPSQPLFARADAALYRAKREGRNRVVSAEAPAEFAAVA